ncbi:MAG: hypothetical protein IJW47_00395 [Clostridia bacterium]|nr:hypothetical protein [Clostridia bacterium]
MTKIYGYKESDVIGLAEFLQGRKGESLSKSFRDYGELNGKAKGTVRNLYYALAKMSKTDKDFCDRYLSGKPLSVGKIVEFSDDEERELIKKILLGLKEHRSVRGAISELSGGDAKLSLRYQNKFRNALKNKQKLLKEIIEELEEQGHKVVLPKSQKESTVSDTQIAKLKKEINDLFERVGEKLKSENRYLKERVLALENENLRLKRFISAGAPVDALAFFKDRGGQDMLN